MAAARQYMNEDDWTVLADARWRQNPMGDLRVFAPLFQALLAGIHADVPAARAQLATVENAAGDDSYAISV